jgi:hypothetical protein
MAGSFDPGSEFALSHIFLTGDVGLLPTFLTTMQKTRYKV